MPSLIQFEDGNSLSYLYAANGTKLRSTHIIDGITTTTDYCGSAIYENGILAKLLTGYGYISLADTVYHYYLKDHQGNNRLVVNQDGTVEEVNHYYPFGGVFANSSTIQTFKYNGKELDRKGGLDWYDYGARYYDAAIGRWQVIDPSAEKYQTVSSYVYCNNNPIKNIDVDGKDWYLHSETGELYFNRNINQPNVDFNNRTYSHIGGNDMLGNMNNVKERSYNFGESAALAQANGYSINPIQQIVSEKSVEQPYNSGKNTITTITGKMKVVNENYGIFSVNATQKVGVKTETLYKENPSKLDNLLTVLIGRKSTNMIERNQYTYITPTLGNKFVNGLKAIYNVLEPMSTGKHDYRITQMYNNWSQYSQSTNGKGRMLIYK